MHLKMRCRNIDFRRKPSPKIYSFLLLQCALTKITIRVIISWVARFLLLRKSILTSPKSYRIRKRCTRTMQLYLSCVLLFLTILGLNYQYNSCQFYFQKPKEMFYESESSNCPKGPRPLRFRRLPTQVHLYRFVVLQP